MAIDAKRDYYDVLGVNRTATEHEIKDAFLRLAEEYQAGDKPENIDAVERFRVIARAYRTLIDPEQRHSYDKSGENVVIGQPSPTGYNDLNELERRARFGYYQWPYCDPALATFLNKLMGWE